MTRDRPLHVGGRAAAAQQQVDGDDRDAEHGGDPPVLVDRPVERAQRPSTRAGRSSSPVPAPPACGPAAVAAVPRKIVSAPSGSSARTAHTPSAVERPRPLARLVARAPGQRRGRDEDQHREREVAHHEAGREVVADREAAEHRLADDAERQQHAERGEVAPERPPPPRERAGGDRGEPDEARRSAGCRTRSRRASRAAARRRRSTSASPGSRGRSRSAAPRRR